MKIIAYESGSKFTRFYLKNPLTDKLEECTEDDFDKIVIGHRDLYEMEYGENVNVQHFLIDGVIEARRERG